MKIFANGIHMNVELSETGESTVMLSHALGTNLNIWNPQVKFLKNHYRVLRYDIRGHGGTSAPDGPYTIEALSEDAISLLDVLGINRVHWVGISIGGMIGMCLALNYAERLKSLILCHTTPVAPEKIKKARVQRIDTALEKGMSALVESMLERWFVPAIRARNASQMYDIRKQFLGTPVTGYVGSCQAIQSMDYTERLKDIKTPTLIITGEEDQSTPVATAKEMNKLIPDSKMVVLASCGHVSNLEQPEVFNEEIIKFISSCQLNEK